MLFITNALRDLFHVKVHWNCTGERGGKTGFTGTAGESDTLMAPDHSYTAEVCCLNLTLQRLEKLQPRLLLLFKVYTLPLSALTGFWSALFLTAFPSWVELSFVFAPNYTATFSPGFAILRKTWAPTETTNLVRGALRIIIVKVHYSGNGEK